MARNPEIEAILDAWWDLYHCPAPERASSENKLNLLLDHVAAKSGGAVARDQVLDFLWSQFKDYRMERRRRERVGVPQSVLRK
jgi:hypothetical protein